MASYLPPTEDVPIFDNSNFKQNLATLTYNDATKGFLTFPFAQGNETFQDITVEGTTDLINVAQAHYTMPASNDASLIIPSTTWVQDAITNAPSNTDIDVTEPVPAGTYYMPMINGSVTGAYTGYIVSGMSFNSGTNNLSTTTFTGALVGNASSATTATNATNSTNATNATNLNLTNSVVSASRPVILGTTGTGLNSCLTSVNITANPGTGSITATTFSGALSGNATTATTATTATNALACSGNSATATNATTAGVGTTTTVTNNANGVNYIPFINSISGNLGLRTAPSNNPTYNTITGQLTAQVFIGNLTGQSSDSNNAQNVSLTTGDDSAGNWYIPYSKTTANDVNRLYIDNITTPLSYNPSVGTLSASIFSGALSGNATSATQINITPNGNNATHYLTFSDTNATGNINLHTNSGVLVNPSTDTISTTNFSASGNMQAPIIQTTANGVIRTYDTGGVLATTLQQIGTDLNITIPATGEMKITTQGTGVIPTLNPDAGTSFLWNVSAGGGESCIVNYQDGGNAGGFDFYNVNSATNSVKIATIPKTQSAFSTASAYILPTYNWVNGTIGAAISAIPSLNNFNMTAIVPSASNTYYGLWANSAVTGSHPINTASYVSLVPNTNNMYITSNLNVLNSDTSLRNVRMQSTPIILAFGNNDGSAGGGADAFNLSSSYLTSPGWTNPSGGSYVLTLTGVAHSIFSATITGNPGTATAGQRPQILTSVSYAGGFTNAYLSVTFTIAFLQGVSGGGAGFNGPFSYSISGIMN